MGKRLKKSRYITGFDGIRTIAVIGVILYHLAPYQFQGGFLGVPIFFVVSGYLITDLLFQEWQQNRRIDQGLLYYTNEAPVSSFSYIGISNDCLHYFVCP